MILKLSQRPGERACAHRTQHDRQPTLRRPKVKQITTDVPAQKPSFHPRAAAATVTDVMRVPLTTVNQVDHVAAAAYLMKHAGTTALMVVNAQTGQPAGIITKADVARAIAGGKDLNDVRVYAAMITRPALTTTTSIRDAAKIMTTRHFRHLPAADDTGLLGVIDLTDVCRALNNAGEE
jgi:CBS domain-containing protein